MLTPPLPIVPQNCIQQTTTAEMASDTDHSLCRALPLNSALVTPQRKSTRVTLADELYNLQCETKPNEMSSPPPLRLPKLSPSLSLQVPDEMELNPNITLPSLDFEGDNPLDNNSGIRSLEDGVATVKNRAIMKVSREALPRKRFQLLPRQRPSSFFFPADDSHQRSDR